MSRTSRADQNFWSYSQNQVELFSGTPNAQPSTLPRPFTLVPLSPQDWDATCKISNSAGLFIGSAVISQGRENVIDVNHVSHHCSFAGEFGAAGESGEQVFTVKGGSYRLEFVGIVHSTGKRATVVVGAWSDQSHDTSYALDFTKVVRADGQPVTFILGRVNNPIRALFGHPKDIALPRGAKVLFWKSLGDQLYWWAKFAAVKMGLL